MAFLTSQSWCVLKSSGSQVGVQNKDFSGVSQTGLTRVRFRLQSRLQQKSSERWFYRNKPHYKANFYSTIIFLVSRVHENIYFNTTITFTTRPKHKHFVIFPGKRGIKCVYLKIISTSKNLTSATENETTKNLVKKHTFLARTCCS